MGKQLYISKSSQISLLDSIVEDALNYEIIFIDLFAGAGGVTSGIERARLNGSKTAKVIACINHDPVAIASHHANYQQSLHLTEDVRTADLTEIIWMVTELRKRKPDIVINLWASLECTNFSRAKGGLSRDPDSRTLAEHLDRYIAAIQPESIWIENVREFLEWGPVEVKVTKDKHTKYEYCPLDIKKTKVTNFVDGKKPGTKKRVTQNIVEIRPTFIPIKERMKEDYIRWSTSIDSMGYRHEHRLLDCANFGEYTRRIRLFIQFAKPFMPIIWPTPTHAKNPAKVASLFDAPPLKWNAVKEKLDFSDEGNCIFDRKIPYKTKTLQRVLSGLIRFVANGDKSFLSLYYSGHPDSKNIGVNGPARAITTIDHHALVQAKFSHDKNIAEISEQDRFVVSYHHSDTVDSIEEPMKTLTTKDKKAIAAVTYAPAFLNTMYGSGQQNRSVEQPLGAITTVNKVQVVNLCYYQPPKPVRPMEYFGPTSVKFLNIQYGQSKNASVDMPAGTITKNPKFQLVSASLAPKWILDTSFNNVGSSIEEPLPTILANRKWHYLMMPQWGLDSNYSVDGPAPTLIARMDKTPPYLISVGQGKWAIKITPQDCEVAVKIKIFMAMYGIVSIKMRMLKVKELKTIQGFSDNYILLGTQAEQKKHIGNSVPPGMVKALIEAGFSWVFSGKKAA